MAEIYEVTMRYPNKDVLLKLQSELTSIITSGKEIPKLLTEADLDIIHMESMYSIVGRTQCGMVIANGVRVVKINNKEKVNCEKCKRLMNR
jgi:hypothetical protein